MEYVENVVGVTNFVRRRRDFYDHSGITNSRPSIVSGGYRWFTGGRMEITDALRT